MRPFYSPGGINVETYDTRTVSSPGEIDFYVAKARESGGPVLEVACGTGRVLWPIAHAGVDIVGIDLGTAMLEQAERKREHETREVSQRARFVRADMTNFDLGEQFALAIVPFRAFLMLLSLGAQRSTLGSICRHVRPGGRLIINIFDPRLENLIHGSTAPRVEMAGARHPVTRNLVSATVLERKLDQVQQRLSERWRFQEVDDAGTLLREEYEMLEIRWIYRYEMRHLLELSGFVIEAEMSDYFGAPPAYGREQIWIVRRPN